MNNWEYKKLGDVCDFIAGYTPKTSELATEGDIPYFKVSDMNRDGNEFYMSETELFAINPKRLIPQNSIVFPKNGGAVFTNKKRILSQDSVIDLNSEAICSKGLVYTNYLYRFFQTIDLKDYSKGAALPTIDMALLKAVEIPLPPLEEQKRIVKILDEKFAHLETVKANAKANLQNAKDLFQSQLTKAFSNNNWEKKRLGEVMTLLSGQDFPPERYNANGKGIPYITGASNFNDDGTILINRWTDTPTVIAKKLDVLLVVKGSGYGKTSIADFEEAHIARQVMALRVFQSIDRTFLFYYLNSKFEEIKQKGSGVIPGITRADVLEMELNLPPIPEQKRIVEQLDSLSQKVRSLEKIYTKQLANCDELKQAFLAKAFAGEL